jgi:hypothetical protein
VEDLYMVLSTDPWAALWSALHGACPSSRMGCSIVDWPNCYELGTLDVFGGRLLLVWVNRVTLVLTA